MADAADGGREFDTAENDAGAADAPRPDVPVRDAGPDVSCRAIESEAQAVRIPADIIMIVDSSASMGESRARIAEVINANFDSVLSAAGVDYQVILMATPALVPVDGALAMYDPPRLFRINIGTGSGPGANHTRVLDNYRVAVPGPAPTDEVAWSTLLREDAVKIFMHFTDATSSDGSVVMGYPGQFDDELYALDPLQFGANADDGKLIYHAFVGHLANDPASEPFGPDAPIVAGGGCGSFGAGDGFQELARRTGGLRFPVCEYDLYAGVFERVAEDVVTVVRVECTFPIPEPPAGETLDLDTVAVRYTPGGGGDDEILLQTTAGTCDDASFVIDEDAGTLSLCPEACARIQSDDDARLDVAFGCDPVLL